MIITVDRFVVSGPTTLSYAKVLDGNWRGFVLEDGPSPDPYGIKVPGETRIPDGEYRLSLVHSPMAKRYAERHPQWHRHGMIALDNVEGFEHIRIHIGNSHRDTDGCLLLGYGVNPAQPGEPYSITQSTNAYKDFYVEVARRLALGEVGRIVVRSPVGP